jgi:predicted CXXCH cytochrome family protein
MQLTTVNGNANLCMSCHNPTGTASTMPFTNLMKAVPGTSGTSHNWNANTDQALYQTNAPTNPGMVSRVYSGQIVCSTCHDQHTSNVNPNFLRIANTEDALCLQCHVARDLKTYALNVANKGTHPVGIPYSLADSRFQAMGLPLSASSKVVCSTCHDTHASASSNGNILRTATNDAICSTCHVYAGYDITLNHKNMTCTTCHYGHNTGSGNIYLINDNILTPNSGTKVVGFATNASGSNYATGAGTNGVCQVCHTVTDHFTNTGIGTADARHLAVPIVKCVTCHPHSKAFAAQTDCLGCHNTAQDKPGVGPVGGRRAVVGAGGDFVRTSHHSSAAPTVADCIKCHYMGDHKDGQVKFLDPDLGYANIITYDPLVKTSAESFCLKCHDANGANGDVTPFSDGVTVPVVDAAMWAASSHKGAASTNTCLNCHDNGHGSNKRNLLGPATYAGAGTGTDLMNEEEGLCLSCHSAAGPATAKVHLAFSSYTNTTTNFYKHDPALTYRKHISGETLGSSFTGTNRHVECVDCHNPHGAVAGTATAPALLPTMIGATGVEPIYGVTNTSPGAPTGFTWKGPVTQEYQVCYKCHSSFTTLPTYQPAGWAAAIVANGLGKLTFISAGQVLDNRDMAREYNPNNNSFHPVMAVGKNQPINAATFVAPWVANSRMYCTDCHDNPNRATAGQGRGPHGSNLLHILDGTTNYKTTESSAATTEVCSKCHQSGLYVNNTVAATNTRFYDGSNLHDYHNGQACSCYMCHDSHGSEIDHNLNFNYSITGHTYVAPATNSQNMFYPNNNPKACNLNCHTTHSTSGKTYTPSY